MKRAVKYKENRKKGGLGGLLYLTYPRVPPVSYLSCFHIISVIGILTKFLPYRYQLMLYENLYQYRYKRKERKKNEELEKCWKIIPKTSFTFKVYHNLTFDLQLLKVTDLFCTFLELLWLNGYHAIMIHASSVHINAFSFLFFISVSADMKCPHIGIGNMLFSIYRT